MRRTILVLVIMVLMVSPAFGADMPKYNYSDYPEKGVVTTEIYAFDNPEACLFSMDGKYLFVSNASVPDVAGAWGWIEGQGSISRLTMGAHGTAQLTERYFVSGLTGPLGMAVSHVGSPKFAPGTIFVATGSAPLVDANAVAIKDPARHKPQIVAFDPDSGVVIGRISMGPGSVFDKINGGPAMLLNALSFDKQGNLYVADTEIGFDSFEPPFAPNGGTWKIPREILGLLAEGGSNPDILPEYIPNHRWVDGIEAHPKTNEIWVNNVYMVDPEDPYQGGTWAYRSSDFTRGKEPAPIFKNLGRLDGLDFTPKGTCIQTEALTSSLIVIPDGSDKAYKLIIEPAVKLFDPAEVDIMTLADGGYLVAIGQFHNSAQAAWDDKITIIRLSPDFD